MIQVPTAEPIRDEPISAINTTNIVIVELVPVIVTSSQRRNKCANHCVICSICSVCIVTVICLAIPI